MTESLIHKILDVVEVETGQPSIVSITLTDEAYDQMWYNSCRACGYGQNGQNHPKPEPTAKFVHDGVGITICRQTNYNIAPMPAVNPEPRSRRFREFL